MDKPEILMKEISRLISNREFEGTHPVKRGSAGLHGLAKAVVLAQGLDAGNCQVALDELVNLAGKITCSKCQCKVLLFAHALALEKGLEQKDELHERAWKIDGAPHPIGTTHVAEVEQEVQAVLELVRQNPDTEIAG